MTGRAIGSRRPLGWADEPLAERSLQFKQCLRERLRLAREMAALRARFAAVVEDYERVIRAMQALGPSLHLEQADVSHPTSPNWGPSALLTFADGRFLKNEQESIDRLLHRLP
jgi:hypothetical protein